MLTYNKEVIGSWIWELVRDGCVVDKRGQEEVFTWLGLVMRGVLSKGKRGSRSGVCCYVISVGEGINIAVCDGKKSRNYCILIKYSNVNVFLWVRDFEYCIRKVKELRERLYD